MADEESNEKAAASRTTTRKKTARKKAVRKKKVASAAAADKVEPDTPSETPAVAPPIPAAAPQPIPAASTAAVDFDRADEEQGMSGWLVMWGPLIIGGFLILVFMGSERTPGPIAVAPARPPAPMPTVIPDLAISPQRAAADLAEAFKAAGIPLPEPRETTPRAVAPATLELPPALQGNPWAPSTPQQATQGYPPPPPPGYGQPQGRHPYGWPPHGYGYAPPAGYGQPVYAYPSAGYGQPAYGRPPAGYGQPPAGYAQPPADYGWVPAPGYGAPQGGYPPQRAGEMQRSRGQGKMQAKPQKPAAAPAPSK